MSVISALLFTGTGIGIGYLYARLTKLEKVVIDHGIDIAKVCSMTENTEKMVNSLKSDIHEMIEWIREDNKTNWGRIDTRLAAIQKQQQGGKRDN